MILACVISKAAASNNEDSFNLESHQREPSTAKATPSFDVPLHRERYIRAVSEYKVGTMPETKKRLARPKKIHLNPNFREFRWCAELVVTEPNPSKLSPPNHNKPWSLKKKKHARGIRQVCI